MTLFHILYLFFLKFCIVFIGLSTIFLKNKAFPPNPENKKPFKSPMFIEEGEKYKNRNRR